MDFNDLLSLTRCWKILEIEKTADRKAIKRAYLKKLKVTNPEEKPEEFQELRRAYELALEQAETQDSSTGRPFSLNTEEQDPQEETLFPGKTETSESGPPFAEQRKENTSSEEEVDTSAFRSELQRLYNNYTDRIQKESWERILCDLNLFNLNAREQYREVLLIFLLSHPHIPQDVLKYLNEQFSLSENHSHFNSKQNSAVLSQVFKRMDQPHWDLDYQAPAGIVDREAYLIRRDGVIDLIESGRFKEARKGLRELKRKCRNDKSLELAKKTIEAWQTVNIWTAKAEPQPEWVKVLLLIIAIPALLLIFHKIFTYTSDSSSYSTGEKTMEKPVIPREEIPPFPMDISVPLVNTASRKEMGRITLRSPGEDHSAVILWETEEFSAQYNGLWEDLEGQLMLLSDPGEKGYRILILELTEENMSLFERNEEGKKIPFLNERADGRRIFVALFYDDFGYRLLSRSLSQDTEGDRKEFSFMADSFAHKEMPRGVFFLNREKTSWQL